MSKTLKKLFGLSPRINYTRLIQEGAMVLDVRTPAEFEKGHIAGAINIPIEQLRANMNQLVNKHRVIIACCTDGSKSWYAKNLLDANGYRSVYNAGDWRKLQKRIQLH
ncbi:MAG: rhodanese-like domain-containing protein [Cyclobacteriaceae bacterium]|nr:rhodanese-like domain-containing protein [Cyclobacteriaceae bacterium]